MFTLLLALVLTILALTVDWLLAPPLWLQLAFWAPVTVGGVIFALRLFKTVLFYAAYERTHA